jgi:hypothetical protein
MRMLRNLSLILIANIYRVVFAFFITTVALFNAGIDQVTLKPSLSNISNMASMVNFSIFEFIKSDMRDIIFFYKISTHENFYTELKKYLKT